MFTFKKLPKWPILWFNPVLRPAEALQRASARIALGLLAKRLVCKLCTSCRGKGCEHCGHTGYQGRTGVFELLVTDEATRAQIHSKASEADIRAAAIQAGMTLMRDDGERLVQSGVTSREELVRVTRD